MNPYIKQFPDLMSGKKIMYVHGFLSSGQSGTVKMLQELMPNATFVAEDIPVHPEEAVEMLQKLVEAEKPDLIIGTSMGGMYTEMLKGYDRILVNPAFEMGNTMSSMTRKQEFQNLRKDGVNELMVTKGLIKEYRDITERCFQDITPEEQARVYGLFGDEDPVVHSFTKDRDYTVCVSNSYLTPEDRVIFIDDFLANGNASKGIMDLCEKAGAKIEAMGFIIEKAFQHGGDFLRKEGMRYEALATVESLEDCKIVLK